MHLNSEIHNKAAYIVTSHKQTNKRKRLEKKRAQIIWEIYFHGFVWGMSGESAIVTPYLRDMSDPKGACHYKYLAPTFCLQYTQHYRIF